LVREFREPAHQRGGHQRQTVGVAAQVRRRIRRLQIAPALMRALRPRLYQHQRRIDMDRDPAALRLAEAEDRRACDELVLDDPE